MENAIQSGPPKTRAKGIILQKNSDVTHPIICLSNVQVQRANPQEHLEIILDKKLNLKCHADKVMMKTSKGITVIKRI